MTRNNKTQASLSKMSTAEASNDTIGSIDPTTAMPLMSDFADFPTDLRFHRFYDEEAGTEHEIFVPPGREQEILDLDANEEWDKLREFPPFSDRPPVTTMHPNVVGFEDTDGTFKQFYVPEDDAKRARVYELTIAKDWKAFEKEFEPWNNQPHSNTEKHAEWERGVVREAAKRQAQMPMQN